MSEMQSGGLAENQMPVQRAVEGGVFRMPLFHPGTRVHLDGHPETVSHVVVRRQLLSVHLVGHGAPVRPEQLELEPTVFSTVRKPEPQLY